MNKYTLIAEEIMRRKKDGEDPNTLIRKYASEHDLNIHETQRVVEEYNVGVFLQKLKEGTHHEDYELANPVEVAEIPITAQSGTSTLDKAASYAPRKYALHAGMFSLDDPASDVDSHLEKVASYNNFTHEDSIEERQEEAEKEAYREMASNAALEKKAMISSFRDAMITDLVDASKETEGLTKTAVVMLAKEGLADEAEEVLLLSKFASSDLVQAKMEPPTEKQKALVGLLKEAKGKKEGYVRRLAKDVGEGLKGTYYVAKTLAKHPFLTAGGVGAVYYAKSKRGHEPEMQKFRMTIGDYS